MQGGRTSRSWLPAPPPTVAVQTGKEKKYRVATISFISIFKYGICCAKFFRNYMTEGK